MEFRNLGSFAARTAIAASAVFGAFALLTVSGCSSSSTDAPIPAQSELASTELQIRLDQCKLLETGLYKCPAFEKDICDPEYTGQAQCVRTGKKGSIFVKSSGGN